MGTSLSLAKNAISHPPLIKNQLNVNSVIIVEDNLLKNDYEIGNSHYPLIYVGEFDYQKLMKLNQINFVKIQANYNGKFFQQAYLMPSLREEEVPFQIEKMNKVPDSILYAWLRQYPNIFCFGYDKQGNWYDRTSTFKKYLLSEQRRRQIHINQYKTILQTAVSGKLIHVTDLPFPDAELCQHMCDKDSHCAGFNYIEAEATNKYLLSCHFFANPISLNYRSCTKCTGYLKL